MTTDYTSVLEVLGILAIAAGVGVLVSDWSAPGLGWIAGGLVLILGSLAITFMAVRPQRSDE